ncbi:MAG: hypothetical protein K2X03_03540 [Bryobacteraceae bacterium]|nr:hypothetical protein [Bryobacteraceae bacterium]
MFSLVLFSLFAIDLDAVKAEPVLEKRVVRALDCAQESLTEARKHYEAGEDAALKKSLAQVADASECALATLEEMGKHPSRNVRHYKPTEMRLREILRRLVTLRNDAGLEVRPLVEQCEKRVEAVHDKLLDGVMSRKPRG